MSASPVMQPPVYTVSMDLYNTEPRKQQQYVDEKHSLSPHAHSEEHEHDHKQCHANQTRLLRRFFIPISLFFLSACLFLLVSYLPDILNALGWTPDEEIAEMGVSVFGLLVKRQTGGGGTTAASGGHSGGFVSRKLYLIIIFVGLVLCLIAGIMLSAWCCKGAFKNPLCCPCYLCACCGGLACLECISCGLCADAANVA